MIEANLNTLYLNGAMRGDYTDHLYHIGINSNDEIIKQLHDIKAIIVAGSPTRVIRMAKDISRKFHQIPIIKLPHTDRATTLILPKILLLSHGMGMGSASIFFQELIKLLYYAKSGNIEEMAQVFWCRVGTCGGINVPAGNVVVSTAAYTGNNEPFYTYNCNQKYSFKPEYPQDVIDLLHNIAVTTNIPTYFGKTYSAPTFYSAQNRTDGAIILNLECQKYKWLQEQYKKGFLNIEMEATVLAGILNHVGIPHFACICGCIVNRMKGDQIKFSENIQKASLNAEALLYKYLQERSII